MERQKIRFASGDTECTAWHYPGTNGGCAARYQTPPAARAARAGAAAADSARH